ncbi:MAG: hypothetical protein KatS3mg105_0113 [Gemmatales bacterium]|nr:MAG: hypothetical protein KatS3mg105_0113 [Gemmatales bacterium]
MARPVIGRRSITQTMCSREDVGREKGRFIDIFARSRCCNRGEVILLPPCDDGTVANLGGSEAIPGNDGKQQRRGHLQRRNFEHFAVIHYVASGQHENFTKEIPPIIVRLGLVGEQSCRLGDRRLCGQGSADVRTRSGASAVGNSSNEDAGAGQGPLVSVLAWQTEPAMGFPLPRKPPQLSNVYPPSADVHPTLVSPDSNRPPVYRRQSDLISFPRMCYALGAFRQPYKHVDETQAAQFQRWPGR